MLDTLEVHSDLIFDIGMHKALDTKFYLAKGFRVVAVEANPHLVQRATEELGDYIKTGQLFIENVGIGIAAGSFPFFVNLHNDEWSSFDEKLGARDGSEFRREDIRCVRAADLFRKHGLPYYLKIDIEGMDWLPVAALHEFSTRPKYISVEDNSFQSLIQLHNIGARLFKFIDQVEKWNTLPPRPAGEGAYVDTRFGAATSGLFGKELPGEWLALDAASLFYLTTIRPPGIGLTRHWWDIHARFS